MPNECAAQRVKKTNKQDLLYRIPFIIRLAHWLVALALFFLLLSGFQIFNAHPALYWNNASDFDRPFFQIGATETDEQQAVGVIQLGNLRFKTTGFFGVVKDSDGQVQARAFPGWLTIPSNQDLASGRRWHFFFAWFLVVSTVLYLLGNLMRNRGLRDLVPSSQQWRKIGRSVWEHLKFRVGHEGEQGHYNILQKLAYLATMFALIPLIVATGLAMSPFVDAAFPWLPILFGGRQAARALHFFVSIALVLFFLVHLLMVILAGPLNELRSIITGWYRPRPVSPTE